ncbi:lytic transglycosylase domain-containing protein [Candidatus Woesearchaeota archaeon]|nr:lytic transglycosylase domain-containing protein [Candidatus Woesearchaeota archaeon]
MEALLGTFRKYTRPLMPAFGLVAVLQGYPALADTVTGDIPLLASTARKTAAEPEQVKQEQLEHFSQKLRKGNIEERIARTKNYDAFIRAAARETTVPYELLFASIVIESSGNPEAHSRKGAKGLMQLLPETAREYGLTVSRKKDERLDPQKNIFAGARYLKDLYQKFGSWELALAAYHAGPGRLEEIMSKEKKELFWEFHAALPRETRNHVPQIFVVMDMMRGTMHERRIAKTPELPPTVTPETTIAEIPSPSTIAPYQHRFNGLVTMLERGELIAFDKNVRVLAGELESMEHLPTELQPVLGRLKNIQYIRYDWISPTHEKTRNKWRMVRGVFKIGAIAPALAIHPYDAGELLGEDFTKEKKIKEPGYFKKVSVHPYSGTETVIEEQVPAEAVSRSYAFARVARIPIQLPPKQNPYMEKMPSLFQFAGMQAPNAISNEELGDSAVLRKEEGSQGWPTFVYTVQRNDESIEEIVAKFFAEPREADNVVFTFFPQDDRVVTNVRAKGTTYTSLMPPHLEYQEPLQQGSVVKIAVNIPRK